MVYLSRNELGVMQTCSVSERMYTFCTLFNAIFQDMITVELEAGASRMLS